MRLLFLVLVLLLPFSTFPQYTYPLPTPEVLSNAGIREIHVRLIGLPTVDQKGHITDSIPFQRDMDQAIFFVDSTGRLDSIYHYPSPSGYGEKDVYTYDSSGMLIDWVKYKSDDQIRYRTTVERLPNGHYHSRTWHGPELRIETIANADSIVIAYYDHRNWTPWHSYYRETYDPEQDIKTTTWFKDSDTVNHETFKWIVEDGTPHQLQYLLKEKREKRSGFRTFRKTYGIRADGYLDNYPSGHGDDPNWDTNFFSRYNTFGGIKTSYQSSFTADHLITSSEIKEVLNFEGTIFRHYFTISYKY